MKHCNYLTPFHTIRPGLHSITLHFLIGLIWMSGHAIRAQNTDQSEYDLFPAELRQITKAESTIKWIKFKKKVDINPNTIFEQYKSAFQLGHRDSMVLFQQEQDNLGYTHYHYQQYFNDIIVDGGIYIVHTDKNGFTYAVNGKLYTGIDINTKPDITSEQAIELPLKYVNATEYNWQSEFWERELQKKTKNPDTTYYPSPVLAIRELNFSAKKTKDLDKQYRLVYRINVYSRSPDYAQRIYIDANKGKVLASFPLQSN